MGFLTAVGDLLKPVPYIEGIKDPKLVSKEYKYWRIRIFYSMYIGYVFFYFSRKSFTFAMPALMNDLGFSTKQLGLLNTVLYITYGISKFTSGPLSDKSNPRYFMSIGLICTGIVNLLFGLTSTLWVFILLWGINGWFQGWGWPPVTKQLTHWYGKRERGTWWSVCSSSHNAGGYLIAILAALLAGKFGWRYAMYIPGVICIAGGILLLNRLRDSPQSLGLPPIEKFKKEENLTSSLHSEDSAKHDSLSVKQILFEHVLINKFVWALAISYFFIYVVRTAFNDWGMWYLVEEKNYSQYVAGLTVSWFEVGGFLGTIFAGWGSDCFFKGKRVPYMVFCAIALIFLVPAFWYSTQVNVFLDSCLMAGIGFFVFGPQMLAGLAAAELVHKKAAGTSNGFAGLFGYLGAAVSGYPLGFVIEKYHWRGFFIALFICSAATLIILLPMWSVGATDQTPEKRKEEDEAANLLWGNAD